jgi:hypothetical protein
VAVTITPKGLGYIYSLLVVDLGSFCVSCLLSAACDGGDPIARELAPSAPYAPKRPPPNEARLEVRTRLLARGEMSRQSKLSRFFVVVQQA